MRFGEGRNPLPPNRRSVDFDFCVVGDRAGKAFVRDEENIRLDEAWIIFLLQGLRAVRFRTAQPRQQGEQKSEGKLLHEKRWGLRLLLLKGGTLKIM